MVTTEDVLGVVARSPHNWGGDRTRWLADELGALGAGPDELVAAALAGLDSDERNVRVRALWALSVLPGPAASTGILRGLRDPVRRVREVAIKSVRPHHVGSSEVLAAVRAIVDDEGETGRLRRNAFFVLSSSALRDQLPEVAEDALRSFLGTKRFRMPVLLRLCTSGTQTATSRAILEEFVRGGSKEEAVMATRALCGQRLMRVDGWLPADVRRRVRATYDPAPDVYHGVPLCWIPAAEADALAAEVGVPSAP